MAKKRRLGRGLDALLSKPVTETPAVTGHEVDSLQNVPVELLQRGKSFAAANIDAELSSGSIPKNKTPNTIGDIL